MSENNSEKETKNKLCNTHFKNSCRAVSQGNIILKMTKNMTVTKERDIIFYYKSLVGIVHYLHAWNAPTLNTLVIEIISHL